MERKYSYLFPALTKITLLEMKLPVTIGLHHYQKKVANTHIILNLKKVSAVGKHVTDV